MPVRWMQTRDAPPLLVDQNRRIGPADGVAKIADQLTDLVRVAAVAPEQDEAERIGVTEERPLVPAKFRSSTPEDCRLVPTRLRAGQSDTPPCAT